MGASLKNPTLAEKYELEFSEITGDKNSVTEKIKVLNHKYCLITISPLTNLGRHIGTRYVFADDSFCDFYTEAPTKIFSGKKHNFKQ